MSDDIIKEAAAKAIGQANEDNNWEGIPEGYREWYRELAMCALVIVEPLIRSAALEQAAKVAEDEDGEYSWAGEHRNMAMLQQHGRELAAAIRQLKDPRP
jgi:hypothetical protein